MYDTLQKNAPKTGPNDIRTVIEHFSNDMRTYTERNGWFVTVKKGLSGTLSHGVCVLSMFGSYRCKSCHSLMEAKCSNVQGRRREARSERSAEQM